MREAGGGEEDWFLTSERALKPNLAEIQAFKSRHPASLLFQLYITSSSAPVFPHTHLNPLLQRQLQLSIMKTAVAASALAMVGSTNAFVTPNAVRAVSPSTTSRSSALSMEFAGGLRGADGPEPNSKNFDPFGFSEARPENVLFFREAEIKVRACLFSSKYMCDFRILPHGHNFTCCTLQRTSHHFDRTLFLRRWCSEENTEKPPTEPVCFPGFYLAIA